MNAESVIGIISGLIGIGGAIFAGYEILKKKPMTKLMNELADKNTSVTRQHKILSLMDKKLMMHGQSISSKFINEFHSNGRSKLAIFYDICNKNDIEPTPDICNLFLGYDEKKFRNDWTANHLKKAVEVSDSLPQSKTDAEAGANVVYMSALLAARYPASCKRLTDLLNKHNIPFAFLNGTKDIWCRDYMPVQTPGGKLIQFKYDPSYLRNSKYSDSRSDVRYVDKVNNISPLFSDINLDGGNVVMYGNKAIITDRIFSENPNWERERLVSELSRLLECEIIIIPSYKPEYDFTGHADGMIRFADNDTVLVNDLEQDLKYMKEAIKKALEAANLKYVNFPWFEHKVKGNTDHAIGIYLNYLEVDNLIVMPFFGVEGNRDAEALAKLQEVFPDKIIETIDFNDVALAGGILNCVTWVIKK
ncbi:MAG: agmatine deiminase family protein [Paramuribaculum sp.]|nr:agmatine deiminase family protein [Paramuribaculum sp.]MDE5837198.1 agmatine deiminase family protein [Paramuribaculum sp.]